MVLSTFQDICNGEYYFELSSNFLSFVRPTKKTESLFKNSISSHLWNSFQIWNMLIYIFVCNLCIYIYISPHPVLLPFISCSCINAIPWHPGIYRELLWQWHGKSNWCIEKGKSWKSFVNIKHNVHVVLEYL